VATRKDAITGTSEFPNLHEAPVFVLDVAKAPSPSVVQAPVSFAPLTPRRLAEPFERLRDASDRILATTGARPKVFLANLGRPSDFNARATFAKNFFEAGGIEAPANDGYPNLAAVVAAFNYSGAKLACICSSDKIYETDTAAFTKALREAGSIVWLAGRPGEHEALWREAGVTSFIFQGCDVLASLHNAFKTLGFAVDTGF
jgi:methylmalonyl-CoA mutase